MRRLPSEPEHIRKEKAREWSEKWRKRRFVIDCTILCVILLIFVPKFISNSQFVENIKYKFNGIDCEIYVPDFENGNGVFIECEGKTVLIDTGINGHDSELSDFFESENIVKIDYLVLSELNESYLNIISEITGSVTVEKIILPSVDDEELYSQFDNMLFSDGQNYMSSFNGMHFYFEDVSFTYLDSESLVLEMDFGNHSFLIYNSAEENRELEIINSKPYLDADVLISLNGNLPSDKFLETVMPEMFIINCDENNDIDLLSADKLSNEIYRTDLNGNILLKSNEVDLEIECENQ